MTCIIGLKDLNTGTIYIGGDRAMVAPDGKVLQKSSPKIIEIDGYYIGFAGPAGLQDSAEMIKNNLSFLFKGTFDEASQKVANMMGAYNLCQNEVLLCNNSNMSIIFHSNNVFYWTKSEQTIYHQKYASKNIEILIAGLGTDIVHGSIFSSSKSDPHELIEEALSAVAHFKNEVSKPFDIFKIR